MPGMGGVAATKRIIEGAAERPPKVLILTAVDDEESIYAALRAGASGFLLKDTSPERLMAAIEAVANGDMPFSPAVVHRLVNTHLPRPRRASPHALALLTDREQDVLRLVATGLSNTDIAGKLFVSEATVKTHLNRTMRKLGLSNRAQAVMVAYETGLIVPAPLTAV